MCGPSNDIWIDPWVDFLKTKGAKYILDAKVVSFNCADQKIDSVTISENGREYEVKGDYYISAVPVEVMAKLLNDDLIRIDPSLDYIKTLSTNVSWMNGTQLYLSENIDFIPGHTIYIDSPWALTSIYQCPFWKNFDITQYGDGKVKGILSIDISDWNTAGIIYNKPARDCTKEEIIKEVWEQLKPGSLTLTLFLKFQEEMKNHYWLTPRIHGTSGLMLIPE
jgi:uncharacterized protein with NAD-binding domain and iron-sulfur cluster